MALFVINRYLGEDNEATKNSKNDDALEKLLEKIDERRKSKLKKLGNFSHLDSDSDDSIKSTDETSVKIKTNNKVNSETSSFNGNSGGVEDGINEVELLNKKKKSKKKRKFIESDLDEIVVEQEKVIKKVKAYKYDSIDHTNIDFTEDDKQTEENLKTELNVCPQSVDKNVKVKSKLKNKRKLVETEESIDGERENANDQTGSKKKKKRKKVSDENDVIVSDCLKPDLHNDETSSSLTALGVSINSDNADNKTSEFTVIGGHNFNHKKPVNWLLPEWLSKPITISGSLKDSSAALENMKGLDETIINNLRKSNINYFFPVQQKVIPWVLSETHCSGPGLRFWPRDICVSAPTGSGKTLSFVLPIIQRLKKRLIRRIGALVVVPVQDLAAQVAKVFAQYAVGTGVQVLSVTGKKMPLQEEQKLLVYKKTGVGYESHVDIMVTTPGRLVEHIKETPGFSLRHLKFLVIDEADRVIDNLKNDWLYHLENHISSGVIGAVPRLSLYSLKNFSFRPQKLLFSATLTQDPEKLKQINLFQPRLFIYKASDLLENESSEPVKTENDLVTNQVMKPKELEEMWVKCSTQLKPLMFYHILAEKKWRGVLCFTHFTDATHRLTRLLHHLSSRHGLNLKIEEISSQRSFNDRHRILNDFRAKKIDVLVCTDVYARGMDILEVRYVVLYSPPIHTRNYIHQVGRTARAGMKGTALTLLIPPQVKSFHRMLKGTGNANLTELNISESDLSYLEKPYKKALRLLKKETIKEKEASKEKAKISKRKNFMPHKRNIKKNNRNSEKKKLKQSKKNKNDKS